MLLSIGKHRLTDAHKTYHMLLGIGICCFHRPTSLAQSTQELANGACYFRRRCRQVEALTPQGMCACLG